MVYLIYGTQYFCWKGGYYFWKEAKHNLVQEVVPEDAMKMNKEEYYSWLDYFRREQKDINIHLFHYVHAE